jgi:hypothetical protein
MVDEVTKKPLEPRGAAAVSEQSRPYNLRRRRRSRPAAGAAGPSHIGSEREATDVPVHQPPDHQDDQDQPEYAADPNGPALTVIAAAVVPKPASKENHEQQDDQNQFHRFCLSSVCRQAVPSGDQINSRRL